MAKLTIKMKQRFRVTMRMFCMVSQLHLLISNMSNYPLKPTIVFYIDTSYLICSLNQVTCFNLKCEID